MATDHTACLPSVSPTSGHGKVSKGIIMKKTWTRPVVTEKPAGHGSHGLSVRPSKCGSRRRFGPAAFMLTVRVLGAAAGGGFPQWNANSEACRRARAGDPPATPATQASIAVSADERRWFIVNASPDLRQQIEANAVPAAGRGPALEPDRGSAPDQRRRRCDRRPAAPARGHALRALRGRSAC